ncbi:MAG: type II toxin-antitoxin system HipA family toxin [Treponema sp.]|jgi:serine/threonine-protein kinase HipA|nr:type II toxin-antitoxin system HipA family toxin [Treponema sp.]
MIRKLNVYLHGEKAGVLAGDEQAGLSFRYESDARHSLSVRMPLRDEEYPHAYAYPYFENLTPEGRPLEIIADKLRVSENNPLSILEKIGGDCAGAVALYEGEKPAGSRKPLKEISEKDMARLIDELPDNPLLTGIENPPRLSLAGAQSKFAICGGTGLYCPNDSYPSTQIIKIGNSKYTGIMQNELFCMTLGRNLGLSIPQSICLRKVKGRLYLDISRYDRRIVSQQGGVFKVERIHQEDFCQALGYPSSKKYQADGGPGLRDCYQAITEYSRNKVADVLSLLQWAAFNYLIGNADAHAKNLSFLHSNGGVTLAPFYDILSTEIYPEKITSRKIAMLINGKDNYEKIRRKDFFAVFRQLGLNPSQAMKNVSQRFAGIAECAKALRDRLNSDKLTASPVYDAIIAIINKRLPVV